MRGAEEEENEEEEAKVLALALDCDKDTWVKPYSRPLSDSGCKPLMRAMAAVSEERIMVAWFGLLGSVKVPSTEPNGLTMRDNSV